MAKGGTRVAEAEVEVEGNGAEVLVEAMVAAGVEVVFANPGTTEMHIVGALDTAESGREGVRSVLCLHETVCAGAADGYGRMKGKPAATLLHLGVGLANALANLHNAKRARSPVLNIVGEMSTWIKGSDPILNMDIEKLAETVSSFTRTTESAEVIARDVAEAVVEGCYDVHGRGGSCVSTIILPHDFAFQAGVRASVRRVPWRPSRAISESFDGAGDFIKACAAALRQPGRKVAVYAAGAATLGGNYERVGKIAAACGAKLFCESLFSRLDRGVGSPHAARLPYFPQDALREFSKYDVVLCIDAKKPVAMFGYEKGPVDLIPLDEESLWEIDCGFDIDSALEMLYKETGASRIVPGTNCRGVFVVKESRPRRPAQNGKLAAMSMCNLIAAHQPEDAVVVDESLTSGTNYYEASKGCPKFSHLFQTGGAIGIGPPLAVGCAVACPDRKVINIQADGSGLYSPQALWTQAKEGLDVVTVVCSNRKYNILNLELEKQKVTSSNHAQNLTSLSDPPIDWVSLAEGFGVKASRATTISEFDELFSNAVRGKGPHLIEAVI
ncbi:thiamine pyrophosphate enzyme [Chloropicon primus]|uniref:Thiamine pyrophosphate enzyme n=2 Tax=Chloropicon primus TaxID=1764295 RepID=A0A5B8MVE2_9CHLO|nr:thiamine pyrophosphate enzyme [Chloropicon primus]|eukprot:QDZ24301.1 thiamine pyrophosphate enzyme [Chloropicon primus]